ncbi:hypothetical protein [Ottowia testudinis]|uniref:Uncharacterized protein n=1 Tax=Ottowia testudinis TaxID=2816950 RepID=A0A975H1K6_9BURK|nr:hypothetical protein [Ottowia testudinis]QTD43923.1 hypothetical protein J1M35_12300 [Ottowia testudinis]
MRRSIHSCFLGSACVAALWVAAGAVQAQVDIKPLPVPANSDSPVRLYPLGVLQGHSIYGMRRDGFSTQYAPGDVCTSSQIVLRAPRQAMTPAQAEDLLQQATETLARLCGGPERVVYSSQNPRPQEQMRGQWVDDALFAQLQAGQTHDEYQPLFARSGFALDARSPQAQRRMAQRLSPPPSAAQQIPVFKNSQESLRGLFAQHGINGWMSLVGLAANPFRYQGQKLLSIAKLTRAMQADVVAVASPRHPGAVLILTNARAADWDEKDALIVIEPQGRYEGKADNPPTARLIQRMACAQQDCLDQLMLPAPPASPGAPPWRLLRDGERP